MTAAPAYVPFNLTAARAAFLRGDFAGVLAQARGSHHNDVTQVWSMAMAMLYGPVGIDDRFFEKGNLTPAAQAHFYDFLGDTHARLAEKLGLRPYTFEVRSLDRLAGAMVFGSVERPAA